MKMLKILIAASFLIAGSASAVQFNNPTSSSNVRVTVNNNGVATVIGNVESYFDRQLVEREVKKIAGVTSVRNLLVTSRS